MAQRSSHPGGTWGAYVEGIPARTGMTMKQVAEKSKIARGTLYKWISGKTGVTAEYVRKLTDATGEDSETAMRAAAGVLVDDHEDPQLRDIHASDLPDEVKQELVDYVLEERRRAEEALQRNVRLMIRSRGGEQAAS